MSSIIQFHVWMMKTLRTDYDISLFAQFSRRWFGLGLLLKGLIGDMLVEATAIHS
jgi:hypothetical protein